MAKKDSSTKTSKSEKQSIRKVIIAGMIGNGLEWYDYALYGFLAPIISKLFFPSENEFVSLVATFGVFAAGFVMRPLGAIIFGYIGDKYGRKISLALSILLMAIPTAMVAFLPTYESIGIAAPILLTIIRLLQGLALGGEFSGSITYIVEHASVKHRGIAGSTSIISLILGMLLGSATAMFFASILSEEAFESWGWRAPFLIGLFIGCIGFYIRSYLDESPAYIDAKRHKKDSKKPLRELFSKYRGNMLLGISLYAAVTIPFYILTVFMNTFMSKILGYSNQESLIINTLCMVILLIIVPIAGLISDQIGRKPVMIASLLALIAVSYPVFWLITQMDFMYALVGGIIFASVLAFYISPIPAVLVEIFPTSVRYSGMALSCNLCAALFGGTAPMLAVSMIELTGNNLIIAFYIILSALVSLTAMIWYKETYRAEVF